MGTYVTDNCIYLMWFCCCRIASWISCWDRCVHSRYRCHYCGFGETKTKVTLFNLQNGNYIEIQHYQSDLTINYHISIITAFTSGCFKWIVCNTSAYITVFYTNKSYGYIVIGMQSLMTQII